MTSFLPHRTAFAFATLVMVLGCNQPQHDFPELYPVQGTVVVSGRPVRGGHIQVRSPALEEAMLMVNADVDEDGRFKLTTVSGKVQKRKPGVPAGSYRLSYMYPGDGQMVKFAEIPGQFVVEAKENTWTVSP